MHKRWRKRQNKWECDIERESESSAPFLRDSTRNRNRDQGRERGTGRECVFAPGAQARVKENEQATNRDWKRTRKLCIRSRDTAKALGEGIKTRENEREKEKEKKREGERKGARDSTREKERSIEREKKRSTVKICVSTTSFSSLMSVPLKCAITSFLCPVWGYSSWFEAWVLISTMVEEPRWPKRLENTGQDARAQNSWHGNISINPPATELSCHHEFRSRSSVSIIVRRNKDSPSRECMCVVSSPQRPSTHFAMFL